MKEVTIGARVRAPEGGLFKTEGRRYSVVSYDARSGKYTLYNTSHRLTVKRRARDLKKNWTLV